MDFNNYVPQGHAYPFFVPAQPGHQYTPHDEQQYDPLDAFSDPNNLQYFDQNAHAQFQQSSVVPPPQSPPITTLHRPSISHALPHDSSGSIMTDVNAELDYGQEQRGSSDEDKDNLTPAQSRRKAQNRAAQRAFRERKERHVKDLEIKLKSMEAKSTDLLSDNERLKRELDRVATQNEILRATSTPVNFSKKAAEVQVQEVGEFNEPLESGPMVYSPRTFSHAVAEHYPTDPDMQVSHRININAVTGERLLATGAAWDYIQNHQLYKKGLVDLGDVVDRLKERVQCDGAGPTFAEGAVERAIEDSVGIGGDELI